MTPESLRTRLIRHGFNLHPTYRSTGGRIRHIAADWREVRVELPLSLRTRNYVGTIYGGSMFAATDPFFMIMLMKNLGPGYEVWDKAASIRFRRPGRSTLHATFHLEAAELDTIREALREGGRVDRVYRVDLVDAAGVVHAEVERVVNVRRREARA